MLKIKRFSLPFLLSIVLVLTSQAMAQEKKAHHKKEGKTVSYTGCLSKGDEPGEFSLKAEDGKMYGLRSTAVSLADHVGHKVTVTGMMAGHDTKKEQHERHKKGEKAEAAHVTVSDLKMVSTSCP